MSIDSFLSGKSANFSFFGKRVLLWLAVSVFFLNYSAGQKLIQTGAIQSKILKRQMNYTVMLPEEYEALHKKYPVIYLLHGINGAGSDWIYRCHINQLADSLENSGDINEYIYIMPDAQKSYYINNFDSTYRYMDYFIDELVPGIDSLYSTSGAPADRALLGLSMGGFGAIITAIKNPDNFGSVMCLSAAVRTEAMFISLTQSQYNAYFSSVYGPHLHGPERITEHWKGNSPYALINNELAQQLSGYFWYIDCGEADALLNASIAFHELLSTYNIPHEYNIGNGTHNWQYWQEATTRALVQYSHFRTNADD